MEARVLQHEVRGEGNPLVLVPGGTGRLSCIPPAESLSGRLKTIRAGRRQTGRFLFIDYAKTLERA